MNNIRVSPSTRSLKDPPKGLNQDQAGWRCPIGADPLATLTRATTERMASIAISIPSSAFWKFAEISIPT